MEISPFPELMATAPRIQMPAVWSFKSVLDVPKPYAKLVAVGPPPNRIAPPLEVSVKAPSAMMFPRLFAS